MTASPIASARRASVAVLLLFAGTFGAPAAWAGPPYQFVDLGTLGGAGSHGLGINNLGQVVGVSDTAGNAASRATLWNGTTAIELGSIGGANSVATGINDAGLIVGHFPSEVRAIVWNGVTPTELGSGAANAVNNAGQVVGDSFLTGDRLATLWNGTAAVNLGTLALQSVAYGINDAGQVVGQSIVSELGFRHATLWSGTTPIDLGHLGGGFSAAFALNDLGQAVGYSTTGAGGITHAAIWNGTALTELGAIDGWRASLAYDINNAAEAVGYTTILSEGALIAHATLWQGTAATDLNSFLDAATVAAGWYLEDARAINDNGWITGRAINTITGAQHAYLLAAVVPEAATSALMLTGLGVLALVALRRKGASRPSGRLRHFGQRRLGVCRADS